MYPDKCQDSIMSLSQLTSSLCAMYPDKCKTIMSLSQLTMECAIYMYCDWENNIHTYGNAPSDTLCKPANFYCENGGFVPNANMLNLSDYDP